MFTNFLYTFWILLSLQWFDVIVKNYGNLFPMKTLFNSNPTLHEDLHFHNCTEKLKNFLHKNLFIPNAIQGVNALIDKYTCGGSENPTKQ